MMMIVELIKKKPSKVASENRKVKVSTFIPRYAHFQQFYFTQVQIGLED